MAHPWNFWYHVTSNSKSTWLPGDPRGFRILHHREHIEGDYKSPPPAGENPSKYFGSMTPFGMLTTV